jgi:predicted nucleotidyltransferase
MALQLPDDFKEFLRLLSENQVEYLLVGGYAVNYYGYPRATADMDVWVRIGERNAERVVKSLEDFGFNLPELTPDLFLSKRALVRMGVPPLRLEILTDISGVQFEEAYARREQVMQEDIEVSLIALDDLIQNKTAAGRPKDILDAEELQRSLAKSRGEHSKGE